MPPIASTFRLRLRCSRSSRLPHLVTFDTGPPMGTTVLESSEKLGIWSFSNVGTVPGLTITMSRRSSGGLKSTFGLLRFPDLLLIESASNSIEAPTSSGNANRLKLRPTNLPNLVVSVGVSTPGCRVEEAITALWTGQTCATSAKTRAVRLGCERIVFRRPPARSCLGCGRERPVRGPFEHP
jgi:hypothetical protein